MYFGTTRVNDNLQGNIKIDEKDIARQEREMKDATADGTMRYREGASGSYIVDASGSKKSNEVGSLNVTVTISGNGPYGPISAEGLGFASMPGGVELALDILYSKALKDATEMAQSNFAVAMKNAGLPPLPQVREESWRRAIGQLITAAGGRTDG
jgi:hypothetical protein